MKQGLLVIVLGLSLSLLPSHSSAQGCVVCTRTASQLDPKSARGLNKGILYIAFLPITIIGTLGYFWWKQSKPKEA